MPHKIFFSLDWNITHSPKHWSTEKTTIEYVNEMIVPYYKYIVKEWELLEKNKASVVIIDNFKGQGLKL